MYRRLKAFIASVVSLIIVAGLGIVVCASLRAARDSKELNHTPSDVSPQGDNGTPDKH